MIRQERRTAHQVIKNAPYSAQMLCKVGRQTGRVKVASSRKVGGQTDGKIYGWMDKGDDEVDDVSWTHCCWVVPLQ